MLNTNQHGNSVLKDEEIIKALECCANWKSNKNCEECPANIYGLSCSNKMSKASLDLINRQKSEIEKYRHIEQTVKDFWSELKKMSAFKNFQEPTLTELLEYIEHTNAEAIKEFAKRLQARCLVFLDSKLDFVDELVKEMTEMNDFKVKRGDYKP